MCVCVCVYVSVCASVLLCLCVCVSVYVSVYVQHARINMQCRAPSHNFLFPASKWWFMLFCFGFHCVFTFQSDGQLNLCRSGSVKRCCLGWFVAAALACARTHSHTGICIPTFTRAHTHTLTLTQTYPRIPPRYSCLYIHEPPARLYSPEHTRISSL